jgi:hypothetical protein
LGWARYPSDMPEPPLPRRLERLELTPREQPNDPGTLMRTCPNCGKPLAERKCKLFCEDPRCGFFLSCAEFY